MLAGPGSVSATFSSQLEIVQCAEILTNIRRETVLLCLQKYHPSSIAELKKRLNEEGLRSTDEDLLEIVRELQSDGEIGLLDPVMLDSFPRFLPGYSTVQILFPTNDLHILEKLLLSIFLSLVISIGIGAALGAGYFFTGVSSASASTGYVIVATIFASHRRYSALRASAGREH